MRTLTARIEHAAAARRGSVTFVGSGEPDPVTWSTLHAESLGVAAAMQARGVRPGDRVAILGPTSRALVTAMQATFFAGATIVVLPLPMRLASLEEFIAATRTRVRLSESAMLVVDKDLAPFIDEQPGDPPSVMLDVLMAEGTAHPDGWRRPSDDPDRLAILQFTSGSTAEPKGVMLPHHTVCANHDGIMSAVDYSAEDDVLVSWLPLYHDMGLVGLLLLSMTTGADLVLASPQDFLASPGRWMEWISTYGGTATAGPNFSYVLATRALRRAKEPLDLSRLRIALNGAEPVDPATVREFVAAAEPHGMSPGAVFPAFGMAEVAIAGMFPPPGRGLVTDVVDGGVLEHERYAVPVPVDVEGARELPRLGKPIAGLEMRIVDTNSGHELKDREVGELQIRGTSLTTGYYRNAAATDELFVDGWLRTGDLAYQVDGELVMCGRIKDVIIVGGRNVFPQDVERAVGSVGGVRTGNVIAFGVEGRHGKESLVVVAETRDDDHERMQGEVTHRVREHVGLPPKDVVLVAPGTIPKTSSGKLQRSLCREQYLADQLQPAAVTT